jgi:hypothetical protein
MELGAEPDHENSKISARIFPSGKYWLSDTVLRGNVGGAAEHHVFV